MARQRKRPRRIRGTTTRRGPDGAEVLLDGPKLQGLTLHRTGDRYRLSAEDGTLTPENFQHYIADPLSRTEDGLDPIRDWALRVLAKEGVLSPEAGGWQAVDAAREASVPHSEVWCAAKALFDVHVARDGLGRIASSERTLAKQLMANTGRAVALYYLDVIKRGLEPQALESFNMQPARSKGGDTTAKKKRAAHEPIIAELRRLRREFPSINRSELVRKYERRRAQARNPVGLEFNTLRNLASRHKI